MDCHTHGAFRNLEGWHAAFTFTIIRQRKCDKSVYTHWELPEMFLFCPDRKGATDGLPLWSLWLLQEKVFACSPPMGKPISLSVHSFQCPWWSSCFVEQQVCFSCKLKYIFSSAKCTGGSHQINYNLSSKRLDLANFFYKAFSIIPVSNSWHLILLLTVPIRVITLKI